MLKNHDKDNQSKNSNEPATEPDLEPEHMWSNPRVRALVMLIITMFIVLMAGIGVLIYKISQRAINDDDTADGQGPSIPMLSLGSETGSVKSETGAKPKLLNLEMNGYIIEKLSTTGKFLTLYVTKDQAKEIWIIDVSGNKIYKTIKLN